MSYEAENKHAFSHEQYFSKHHVLDICHCAFKNTIIEPKYCIGVTFIHWYMSLLQVQCNRLFKRKLPICLHA